MSLIPSFFGGQRKYVSDLWDPFQDFSFTGGVFYVPRETMSFANIRIDRKETSEAHIFKADLPGVKKEEVKVEVEEGRIQQISGDRRVEKEEKSDKWYRVEQSSDKFMWRFRLLENVKVNEVKTAMENGVLTVTVPKAEVKKDAKAIDISS